MLVLRRFNRFGVPCGIGVRVGLRHSRGPFVEPSLVLRSLMAAVGTRGTSKTSAWPAAHAKPPAENGWRFDCGGAEEDRTPDLRIANATLSQLSYRPTMRRQLYEGGGRDASFVQDRT